MALVSQQIISYGCAAQTSSQGKTKAEQLNDFWK